MNYAEVTLMLV